MNRIEKMYQELLLFGNGPLLEEMPRCTLADKGIAGPTAAHRIEEVHTPLNLAYLTFTTGSSAFQNIVGITHQELPARIEAGKRALEMAGIRTGDHIIITYPPLVNVFTRRALDEYGVKAEFILRPSRDALLTALCGQNPRAVIGESAFLRSALIDAERLGIREHLPSKMILVAAGSLLDAQLAEEVQKFAGASLHDLYGCQEFGWLTLDGIPLRKDIVLWDSGRSDLRRHLIVGGIATGDCFLTGRHPLNSKGCILTATRMRAETDPETTVVACTASGYETVVRAARTVLRIKGRIVRVPQDLVRGAPHTMLSVSLPGVQRTLSLEGPAATRMFDDLLEAQRAYQREAKTDPVWSKSC